MRDTLQRADNTQTGRAMADDRKLTLFHSPNTRSSGALTLLEELGVPYELHVLNMKAGEQRRSEYLTLNPMGKVPALRQGAARVGEQVAFFLYLAALSPAARLAPPLGDPPARPISSLDGVLCRLLRASSHRPRHPARPGPVADVALRRLRHDAEDLDRPARQRALPAWRTIHRGRRAVGCGAHLDHDVQAGS